ncbi:sensor histidine kinase [Pseudomarimonas salicorniae]|uniref:histidine kinase n=1 Tax=Pseudomarimonas salicorniae TaxID=2933270 RepID=A0ABT0GJ55_9GAMM|nr:ATP-binding protein [Lysobacter sp. CAU 1642]MCK7594239.1 DUF4118 domain-containing protein [Lysobacter sp. CAU 1642]
MHSFAADRSPSSRLLLVPLGITLLGIAAALLGERWLGLSEPSLVILLGVLLGASRSSTVPAVAAALVGFIAYNVLFIEPRYSLHIGSQAGWVTGLAFLLSALFAGRLASRLAQQVAALDEARQRAVARQALGRILLGADDEAAVMEAAHRVFADQLGVEARTVDAHGSPVAEGTETLPLPGPDGPIGFLALRDHDGGLPRLGRGQRALAEALAMDVAQALLRLQLARALNDQRVANETERLRSALLASVSHDLRSPLSGIIGAAGTLESYSEELGAEDRRSLLETIREEGERLDRYIQNLLDMTRLGHQTLPLKRDWIGVDELVGAVVARAHRQRPGAQVEIELEGGMPPIWVHAALIEQALFNILENAQSFSPPDEPVLVRAGLRRPDLLVIEVLDRGPGVPESERERIFDFFHSVERGDRGRQGTGLGLTICRGMVGAHGGEVTVHGREDGQGSCFRVSLPLLEEVPG